MVCPCNLILYRFYKERNIIYVQCEGKVSTYFLVKSKGWENCGYVQLLYYYCTVHCYCLHYEEGLGNFHFLLDMHKREKETWRERTG